MVMLRNYLCVGPIDYVNYSDFTVYEISDMLKLYFRELPEVLLTDKLSEVLISVQEGKCVKLMCIKYQFFIFKGYQKQDGYKHSSQ